MRKHIVILVLIGIFVLFSGLKYKQYVVDYDYSKRKTVYTPEEKEKKFKYETIEIFIPSADMKNLTRERVKILKTEDKNKKIRYIYEKIVEKSGELDDIRISDKNQPNDGETIQKIAFFNKVKLLDVFTQGDRIYLNFDIKLKNSIMSEKQELLLIYSLVNSTTSIRGVRRVKLLINNRSEKILKFYNISDFFERDTSI